MEFTETQRFPVVAYGALGLSAVTVAVAVAESGLLWPLLPMSLALNLLCLRIAVTDRELVVSLGVLFPLYRRRIARAAIASAEAVTYSPIADYGGWGIKWGRGGIALNARGNRGVQLTLRDGRRVLIGSQKPDALAEALTAPR